MKPSRWTSSLLVRVVGSAALLTGVVTTIGVGALAQPAAATGPALELSTTTLSWGDVTLGDEAPQEFTFTNTSLTETDVIDTSSATFSGPGQDDFVGFPLDTCPLNEDQEISLDPGGTCTIAMLFLPGALGLRTATIAFNDSLDSGASISMSGTGSIGYYQVGSNGAVAHDGDAGYYGDASGLPLNSPIVGMAQTGDNGGYWLAAADGGIFNYGDAGFYGSAGSLPLNKPIVGMASTVDGGGYFMVASDGGIFTYGDASFYGSTGGINLNKPIVGMAVTPDGGGYWLVASDGGIFSYGDAGFYGSTGSLTLNKPIVGMASTPDGGGYWLVASDGGIFAFGDAQFYGSTGSLHLNQPIVGMTAMPDGGGYWFTAADGGIFNYGDAPFYGSATDSGLGQVVGMTTDGVSTLQAYANIPAQHHDLRTYAGFSSPARRPVTG